MTKIKLDKKCGESAIPDGKQCHKKTSTTTNPFTEAQNSRIKTSSRSKKPNLFGLRAGLALTVGSAQFAYAMNKLQKQSGDKSYGIAAAGAALGTGLGLTSAVKFAQGNVKAGAGLYAGGIASTLGGAYAATQYFAARQKKQAKQRETGFTGSDPFKELGIDKNSSEAEIRRAFLKKAQSAHPDKGGSNEKMATLNAAYKAALFTIKATAGSTKSQKRPVVYRLPKADSMWAWGF